MRQLDPAPRTGRLLAPRQAAAPGPLLLGLGTALALLLVAARGFAQPAPAPAAVLPGDGDADAPARAAAAAAAAIPAPAGVGRAAGEGLGALLGLPGPPPAVRDAGAAEAADDQDEQSGGSGLSLKVDGRDLELSNAVKILALLTVLTLAPAILLLMTCFTRIIVVLSFLRHALGTQQMPPNQVMIGLALFLTLFVMAPVGAQVKEQALQPYQAGQLSQTEALERALVPVKGFMLRQTRQADLALFYQLSGEARPATMAEVGLTTLVPAYVISELKTSFQMGFLLFIPFLLIDMVVSSVLMGMGMMMLPPVMISMPIKILLFVMADGWNLLVGSLVRSFA